MLIGTHRQSRVSSALKFTFSLVYVKIKRNMALKWNIMLTLYKAFTSFSSVTKSKYDSILFWNINWSRWALQWWIMKELFFPRAFARRTPNPFCFPRLTLAPRIKINHFLTISNYNWRKCEIPSTTRATAFRFIASRSPSFLNLSISLSFWTAAEAEAPSLISP